MYALSPFYYNVAMKCFLCDPEGFNPHSDFLMPSLVSSSLTVVSADKGSRPDGARDAVHQQVPRSRRYLGLEIETPTGPMINPKDDHWSGSHEAPESPEAPEAPPGLESRESHEAPEAPEAPSPPV